MQGHRGNNLKVLKLTLLFPIMLVSLNVLHFLTAMSPKQSGQHHGTYGSGAKGSTFSSTF
jgi:hypothetical protein